MTHFLDILDVSQTDIQSILSKSVAIRESGSDCLTGRSVGMIFEKPSNRTRISFDVGIHQLGGHPIMIQGDDIQMGSREPTSHVARVLSRYVDMVMYRTRDHQTLLELGDHATVPVINGLSDVSHPCQAVADVLTIQDHFGGLDGVFVTYIGDYNNVCKSLVDMADRCGFQMAIVCPRAYWPKTCPNHVMITDQLSDVIARSSVLYTDVWVSMGDESEARERMAAFQSYQISMDVVRQASDNVMFLHCLPANVGQEVTNEVLESPMSKIFDQAENRLHAQKGVMAWLMEVNQ